jgi:hypothetical protein
MKQVMMKMTTLAFSIAVCLALFCWASAGQAQENFESSDEFEKSKEEFGKGQDEKPPVSIKLGKEERPEWISKDRWGGWGGPMAGGLMLDLSALDPMTDDRGVSDFNDTMTVIGGMGGMAYSNADKKGWWRFGGMGFGANQHESDRVDDETRRAEISIGGGGLFVEYHHPLASRVDLGLGGLVGAGSITLKAEGDDLGLVDDDWSESESFWFGYPYAGVSLKVLDWMRLEAMAGYLFMDADLSGADFVIDESDMEMTDGDIEGGMQYMVRLLFGFQLDREKAGSPGF